MATEMAVSMPKVRERAFRDSIIEYAKLRGWRCYFTWRSDHSPAGYPDLTLCREDRVVFAELKVKPNKPTKPQREWLDALDRAGQETHVWYPEDWDVIEGVLR